jgi:hypothetical protein
MGEAFGWRNSTQLIFSILNQAHRQEQLTPNLFCREGV